MAITKWSISSDGTPNGTVVTYDGRVLGDILDLSVSVRPGSFVVGNISFVTKLGSFDIENSEQINKPSANADDLIDMYNEVISLYVRKELTKWLGGDFA